MKHLSFTLTFTILILFLFVLVSCDTNVVEPISKDTDNNLSKIVRYSYSLNLDEPGVAPPYTNCPSGDLMKPHGVIEVHVREVTLRNGDIVYWGYSDYNAHGGVTLENLTTGEIWNQTRGRNPFGEVVKSNGAYFLKYGWYEVYENKEGEKLRVFVVGTIIIDSEGNLKVDQYNETCF